LIVIARHPTNANTLDPRKPKLSTNTRIVSMVPDMLSRVRYRE
jgi:hypothetical protein